MQDGSNQLAAPVLAAPLLEQRRPSDGGSTSALDGDARQPSVARRWSNRRHRKLGVVSVAMIVFFNVSGGPIGSEQVVTYGGPFVGLGAMALFACVFSVPQAMMTAELSTRAVLRVAASVVEGSKQGDISDAVKSRLLV